MVIQCLRDITLQAARAVSDHGRRLVRDLDISSKKGNPVETEQFKKRCASWELSFASTVVAFRHRRAARVGAAWRLCLQQGLCDAPGRRRAGGHETKR